MNSADERESRRLAAVERNRQDAAPIIRSLRSMGFDIDWVADLYNQKLDYRAAVPVLIDWLPRVSNVAIKEDIVRALSVRWAKHAAPLLVREFESASDESYRWALGNALNVLTSEAIADDLIRLATDRSAGTARQMVVLGLGKLKDPRVPDLLISLLADPDVQGHAIEPLGKLEVRSARPHLQKLTEHPKAWIRKEAHKALKRIDRAG